MPPMAAMTNITVTIIRPFQKKPDKVSQSTKLDMLKKTLNSSFFPWTIDKGNAITKRIDNM